jgi:hypothetical protein
VTDWQNAFSIGRNFFTGSKKAARYDSLLQDVSLPEEYEGFRYCFNYSGEANLFISVRKDLLAKRRTEEMVAR